MTTLAEATQPRDTSQMALLTAPAKPPLPPAINSDADPQFNSRSIAPIPPALGTDVDAQRQFYRTGVSQQRMLPIQPAASSAGGAASASQAALALAPLQAQVTAQGVTIAQSGYQGAWSASASYSAGALVEEGGVIYIALLPSANIMPPNATYWAPTSAVTFSGIWSSTTAYTIGDIVSVGAALYIAIANSTNENPTTTTGYWQLLTGTSVYAGEWNNSTAYSVGTTVSYTDGNFYIAIVANTNVAPAPVGSTDWVLLGTSNTLIGAYSGTTAYTTGNQVTNAGFIFQALQATTGNAPPTPPTTSSFWILVGPASIDPSTSYVLAKGSTPLTQNTGLSYTSTTTSIDLVWEALALYRADGTITTVGSSSQNITGLGSGRTFFVYPRYIESTGTFEFVSNSDVSFPTLKGIAYTNAGNQYATTTTSAALPTAFTLSLWVQVASGYAGAGGLTVNTSHTTTPLSSVNSVLNFEWNAGAITAAYRDSGGTLHTLTSTQTYNDGEFHSVVYTCDPTNSSQVLYVDGISVATGSVATAVSATSGYFWLNRAASNATMTGTLTEIAFFNTALTAANASAIYNAGNSISQTALETVTNSLAPTIYWTSTDAGPTTIADSGSIGGNTGTAQNSPTFGTTAAVFGSIGTPAIAWPSRSLLVSQVQAMQGSVPFSQGGWAVATPSGGTGGGSNSGSSGGSGTGCYSRDTKVQTPNGLIAISELQVGDFVISHGGVARKVAAVLRHEPATRTMIDMGTGYVTPNHIVADGNEWTSAGELFKDKPKVKFGGEVFNLSVEGDEFDQHSYMLANGTLSHNAKFS